MGMSAGGGKAGDRPAPDVNVTPLIDVCLVLLVIFMVITPMLQKGAPVELPRTSNPQKKADSEHQKIVSIDKNGTLFIDQDPFPEDDFFATMREEKERDVALEVHVKGDRSLAYGDVLAVMRGLNEEASIHNVSLVTEKIETEGF